MEDYIKVTLGIIGFGVVLHFYAFAVAWGIAKGWAKVKHVIEHTGTQTQIYKTEPVANAPASLSQPR